MRTVKRFLISQFKKELMGLPRCLFMILLNLLLKYQLFNFTILEIPEMEFQTISIFEYRKKKYSFVHSSF